MNSKLKALMTQLTWQARALEMNLQACRKRGFELENDIKAIEEKSHQNHTYLNLVINPELEISRLHFLLKLQDKKQQCLLDLKEQEDLEKQIEEKVLRLKIEIKAIEKHLHKEIQAQLKKDNKQQEQAMDEWALRLRTSA